MTHAQLRDQVNDLLKKINEPTERNESDPDFVNLCGVLFQICEIEIDAPAGSETPWDSTGAIVYNLFMQNEYGFGQKVMASRQYVEELSSKLVKAL